MGFLPMRARHRRAVGFAAAALVTVALGACGSDGDRAAPAAAAPSPDAPSSAPPSSPAASAGPRAAVTVTVPAGLGAAPFDRTRQLELPAGWTASVYARVDKARFLAPTPSGDLLVSQPSGGKVMIVRPGGPGAAGAV